jgi:hypothetical protein
MALLAAWLLYPAALALLCTGLGLLVESAAGRRLSGALVPALGFAGLVAGSRLITASSALAPYALPVLIVVALAGWALAIRRRDPRRPDPWLAAAVLGVLAVYAAPVVLSGHPTFAGYTSLPDTSHQLTLAHLFATHGPDWSALPEGSERLSLIGYVGTAYPAAGQAALGVTAPLGLLDLVWLYQPFLTAAGVVLALSIAGLLGSHVASRPARAAIAFIAAQPALTVSYALQGSIKEVVAAALLALAVAVVVGVWTPRRSLRDLLPLAVVGAAGFGALGPAIGAYLVVLAVPVVLRWVPLLWGRRRRWELVWGAGVIAAFVALSLPLLRSVRTSVTVQSATLDAAVDLGNLAAPLSKLHAFGVWLNGDYRYAGAHSNANLALIGIMAAAVVLGLAWCVRRRLLGPALYLVVMAPVSVYLLRRGSPYADAKVLALLAPAVLLIAAIGPWSLVAAGRRLEGLLLAAVVAGGVLASNALAYHDVSLAPYDRYAELLSLDDRLAGKGPAFFNEYDEFAKYFLRDVPGNSMPESVLLWRHAPFNPDSLHDPQRRPSVKTPVDADDMELGYLQANPYLVLRRSPLTSRPPSNFKLIWSGRWYELWQRQATPVVKEHVPLGLTFFQPTGRPKCSAVRGLARRAERSGARLATVERRIIPYFIPTKAPHPAAWYAYGGYPGALVPVGQGRALADLPVAASGRYRLWLEGSFGREVRVLVDGREVGSVRDRLNNPGNYEDIGDVELSRGRHSFEILQSGGGLAPGNGGSDASLRHIGPLAISPVGDAARTVETVEPSQWRSLCGRHLDWIEIVS